MGDSFFFCERFWVTGVKLSLLDASRIDLGIYKLHLLFVIQGLCNTLCLEKLSYFVCIL